MHIISRGFLNCHSSQGVVICPLRQIVCALRSAAYSFFKCTLRGILSPSTTNICRRGRINSTQSVLRRAFFVERSSQGRPTRKIFALYVNALQNELRRVFFVGRSSQSVFVECSSQGVLRRAFFVERLRRASSQGVLRRGALREKNLRST